MRPTLMLAATAATFALVACDTGPNEEAQSDAAAGQVEGGEISDAMLPVDSLRSTSPADPGGNSREDPSEPGTRRAPARSNVPASPPSPIVPDEPEAEEPVAPQAE